MVSAVAFSPNGRTLASGSNDGTVRVWSTAARSALGVLRNTGPVRAVAFSPDGRMLAYGGDDRYLRLWDTADHTELGPFTVGAVNALAFSRDGRTLATAGNGGTIRLWKGILWRSLTELRTTVCAVIGTGLSRSDWSEYAAGIPYRRSCS
jgi:WD40 repeat protein